jgi:hypothetical protein
MLPPIFRVHEIVFNLVLKREGLAWVCHVSLSLETCMLVQLISPLRPGLKNVSLFQLEKLAMAEHIVNHYHHFTSTIPTFCQEFQVQGPARVGSDRD